jgi:hypothetical protein
MSLGAEWSQDSQNGVIIKDREKINLVMMLLKYATKKSSSHLTTQRPTSWSHTCESLEQVEGAFSLSWPHMWVVRLIHESTILTFSLRGMLSHSLGITKEIMSRGPQVLDMEY